MLFSYVILCDFFPLYDFQCVLNTEEQHRNSEVGMKNVANRSISNSTENGDYSSKYGLQQHSRPSTSEIILSFWLFTLLCEEIRQVNRWI